MSSGVIGSKGGVSSIMARVASENAERERLLASFEEADNEIVYLRRENQVTPFVPRKGVRNRKFMPAAMRQAYDKSVLRKKNAAQLLKGTVPTFRDPRYSSPVSPASTVYRPENDMDHIFNEAERPDTGVVYEWNGDVTVPEEWMSGLGRRQRDDDDVSGDDESHNLISQPPPSVQMDFTPSTNLSSDIEMAAPAPVAGPAAVDYHRIQRIADYRARQRYSRYIPRRNFRYLKKLRALYPDKDYGYARIKRGSGYSLATFGSDWNSATDAQKMARRESGFSGKGPYTLQGALGGALKGAIKGGISGFLGKGDYTAVASNGIVHGEGIATQNNKTEMLSGSDGSIRISKTEYVCDVVCSQSGSFQMLTFALNPGIASTFPWLSQIAANYDEYEFDQLLFSYTPNIAEIGSSTNGVVGTITMACCYDPDKAPFQSRQQMLDYNSGVGAMTTSPVVCGVECDRKSIVFSQLYIRTGVNLSGSNRTTDHGLFQVALNACPPSYVGNTLGELRVTYSVTLRCPKLVTALGLTIAQDVACTGTTVANNVGTMGPYFFGPSGGANFIGTYNSLGCTYTVPSAGGLVIGLPFNAVGSYRIRCTCQVLAAQPTYTLGWNAPVCAGNVTLQSDIPMENQTGRCVGWYATQISSCTVGQITMFEAHVFVSEYEGNAPTVTLSQVFGQAVNAYCQTVVWVEEANNLQVGNSLSNTALNFTRYGQANQLYPL